MRSLFTQLFIILFLLPSLLQGQSPGDTIVVNALDYSSRSRDTLVSFPDNGLTYEKIILKYGMRCKGGLVSTGTERNKGCGEWDYSCNTYIVDSSKIEEVPSLHPNYIISGFTGDTFLYTTRQTHDYFQYVQQQVDFTVNNENNYALGTGTGEFENGFLGDSRSGQFLFMYTAQEIIDAGFTAGELEGISMNVPEQGADVNFLRLEIATTNEENLDPAGFNTLSFNEVYFRDTPLSSGDNSIVFTSPFDWDGSSSLVFRVSYTNTGGQAPLKLTASTDMNDRSFYAHNNYSVDLAQNGRFDIDPTMLSSIENELTVSFWTKGNPDFLPANTTLLWGYDQNPGDRDLNIHHPWGNGQIYFDCGFQGGYDRINKQATPADYSGFWNFWTFTKDANSGIMRIYLNGEPWHSGNGNTRTITLNHLILGMNQVASNNYKGEIAELRIWDKVIDESTLVAWHNRHVNDDHPNYDNLVAYYDFSEGSGSTITDAKHNLTSEGENIYWKMTRGDDLFRDYYSSDLRPDISLHSGDYTRTIRNINALDSVKRSPNIVREYIIQANPGQAKDDDVLVNNSYEYFEARDEILYDGVTLQELDRYPVQAEGTIIIEDLDYIRRFPFYNEIMSFVTPYGIGLDLGPDGKAWYFDMTDFAPILKGDKRLLMTLGGQNQEEMDLDFLFIVGTPPRDVIAYNQLWQGAPRLGSARINTILDDSKFPPLTIDLHPDASYYKLRSTITGHGSEGEFHQNGGLVYHMLNLDGGFEEYVWNITQECSRNPVFPQGGTWVYDRQGWCPGERSLLTENDITELVEQGGTLELDYHTTEPPRPTGDYRYIVSHQLVSYGPANHQKDAAVIEVQKPNENVLFTRLNPACDYPVVVIQNTGEEVIREATITYWVNDGERRSYSWSGYLDFLDTEEVELPADNIFEGLSGDGHTFHAEIRLDGDEYNHNNEYQSSFGVVDMYEEDVIIELRTNNNHFENRYTVTDENGDVVSSNLLQFANRVFRDTFSARGCYRFQIFDNGGDGLSWWANPNQGSGYIRIRDRIGRVLKTLEPDFGGELSYSFGIGMTTNVTEKELDSSIEIYPNPAAETLNINGLQGTEQIKVFDAFGNNLRNYIADARTGLELDVTNLVSGVYYIQIHQDNAFITRKVIIVH